MNLTFSGNLQYQAPGGSNVSQSLSVNQATYTAQQGGSIDIPSGTPSGTAYPLQFGAVATAIALVVKGVDASVGLWFNGQTGGAGLPVGTGGQVVIANPNPAQTAGVTSAVIVTNRIQQVPGRIDFLIFGD